MFVDPAEVANPDYQALWDKLRNGEYVTAEFRRIGKGDKEVWIHEISRNTLEATRGSEDIAQTITGVAEGASMTAAAATQTQQTAAELASTANSSKQLVDRFNY